MPTKLAVFWSLCACVCVCVFVCVYVCVFVSDGVSVCVFVKKRRASGPTKHFKGEKKGILLFKF